MSQLNVPSLEQVHLQVGVAERLAQLGSRRMKRVKAPKVVDTWIEKLQKKGAWPVLTVNSFKSAAALPVRPKCELADALLLVSIFI